MAQQKKKYYIQISTPWMLSAILQEDIIAEDNTYIINQGIHADA